VVQCGYCQSGNSCRRPPCWQRSPTPATRESHRAMAGNIVRAGIPARTRRHPPRVVDEECAAAATCWSRGGLLNRLPRAAQGRARRTTEVIGRPNGVRPRGSRRVGRRCCSHSRDGQGIWTSARHAHRRGAGLRLVEVRVEHAPADRLRAHCLWNPDDRRSTTTMRVRSLPHGGRDGARRCWCAPPRPVKLRPRLLTPRTAFWCRQGASLLWAAGGGGAAALAAGGRELNE